MIRKNNAIIKIPDSGLQYFIDSISFVYQLLEELITQN